MTTTPGTGLGGPTGVGVAALAALALVAYLVRGGALLLLLVTAALLLALVRRRSTARTGPTTPRAGVWAAAAVLALPLLSGVLIALGGALSQDVPAGTGDGPDEQASTLASGVLTSGDLTSAVRAALEGEGHVADAVHCPTLSGTTTESSYDCTGSAPGWQRVVVNMHGDRRFTVVGISAEP